MSEAVKTTALEDDAARRAGRTHFDAPLVLEAGAGTGKTAVLVARIVHWCLQNGWERHAPAYAGDPRATERTAEAVASGVVAITFTDAAAVEMQLRVASALRAIVRDDVQAPGWLAEQEIALDAVECRRRAEALSSCADRLRIQTIHAFCSSLLREHALDVGLHPRFQIDAEQRALRELALDVVGRSFDRLWGDPGDADAVLLAERGHGPAAVVDHLARVGQAALRPDELPEDPLTAERFADWLGPTRAALEAALPPLAAAAEAARAKAREKGRAGEIEDCAPASRGIVRAAESGQELLTVLAAATQAAELEPLCGAEGWAARFLAGKIGDWAEDGFTKTEVKELGAATETIREAMAVLHPRLRLLRHFDAEVLTAGCRLLRSLLAEFRDELRARGLQSFEGLMRDARRLLRDSERAAVRVRDGIDQLLVDEFQDTDVGQCELIARLALDELPTDHRPGLFLVGDPKQSIYGWRNADLAAYDDFVRRLLAGGAAPAGRRESLQVNFRSVPPILDEVQRCVEPVMVEEPGRQPAFQPLLPAPKVRGEAGFSAHGRSAVEHWVAWADEEPGRTHGSKTDADRAREVEARAIAADLHELHDAGALRWSDAALLMRSTTGLDHYLRALREAGIPYQVERDRSYYRRREIIDAASLVRTVVDPHDQLALVTALRSPLVGVPDAAWLPLWKAEFPDRCARLRGPGQDELLAELTAIADRVGGEVAALDAPGVERIPHWPAALRAAVENLAVLRQAFHTEPTDVFVELLRNAFLHESTEAARFLGGFRLANLERFYQRLAASLADDEGGPQAVLRALRLAVAEEQEEADSPPGDDSLDAVRVMTVHKAKGLTFGHVYLVDTHAGGRGGARIPSFAYEERAAGPELCLFGVPTLGWHKVEEEQQRVADAELVRLLYVALTRPQHRLVVSGKRESPRAGARNANLEQLLRARIPEPGWLEKLWEGDESPERRRADGHGAQWRVLGTPAPSAQPARRAAEKVRVDALRDELQMLRAARAQALESSRRDRLRTASRGASHEPLRLAAAGGLGDEEDWLPRGDGDRELARAVGTAVHRALERIDLSRDPVSALDEQIERLGETIGGHVPAHRFAEVVARAREVLQAADASGILHELFERRAHILGREVPILLPPSEPGGATVAGTLDLLYRDANTGQLIVADFKTDHADSDAQLAQLCEHYREQGARYVEAVRRNFPDADTAPAFELWFLTANRIATVPLDGADQ